MIIIESLKQLNSQNKIKLFGYVIMPDHIHLIWQEFFSDNEKERPKAAFMKFTGHQIQKRLKKYNSEIYSTLHVSKTDRKVNIWQKFPQEKELVTREILEQKLDYIHENPMQPKYKLAQEPPDYRFSSARYYEDGFDEFNILTHYYEVI